MKSSPTISSDGPWIIQSSFRQEPRWMNMSAGAVEQLRWEQGNQAYEDMVPTTLEKVVALITVQSYNHEDYNFRLFNIETQEEIPFDALL